MAKDCSIYFDKRKIVLTENLGSHFNDKFGLFASYNTPQELSKILDFFQTTTQVENVFVSGSNLQSMLDEFSCMYRLIVASGGLVENSKGELLFIFRYGKWDLPKGKLEKNEKIKDAALREVSEETGITNIKLSNHIVDTYHTYKIGNELVLKKAHWFKMIYSGDQPLIPQQSEDITMAKWFPKNHLDEIMSNTYDTIREVLNSEGVL